MRDPFDYQPYFCEENVWQLAGRPEFQDVEKRVVFISNAQRTCAMLGMKAEPLGQWVIWDYHVILLVKQVSWQVWDLDTRFGMPLEVAHYLDHSFVPLGEAFLPRFRVVDWLDFVGHFSSDRSHMIGPSGWLATPPDWPPILQGESNLMRWVSQDPDWMGECLDLQTFRCRFITSAQGLVPKQ